MLILSYSLFAFLFERSWLKGDVEQVLQTNRTKMAEEKEYDLMNRQHLFDFLIDANIRLVRKEYLLHLAGEKRLWPRRQEAEHETFVDEDGLMKTALMTLEEYKKHNVKSIYSVSHCWEAKQHPDPFGFQARELLPELLPAARLLVLHRLHLLASVLPHSGGTGLLQESHG